MLERILDTNDFSVPARQIGRMRTQRPNGYSAQRRIWLRAGGLILVLAALLVGLTSCTSNAQPAGPPLPLVETITVSPDIAELYSEYPAQTYARDQVEIRGRVDGYIEQWLFRPGQHVRAGQPLYSLDLRPYRAQLEQAKGNMTQAEADLTNAQQQTSLLQAQANLAAAEAALVRAKQDHERIKPLVEQDAAARQDLDAAVAALRSAESTVRANEAAVAQAKLNTQTLLKTAQGRVQSYRGALQTASLNLQYGTITAPISGIIGDTRVSVGGLVTTSSEQPLTTIVPLDPIWVRFKLSESEYASLRDQLSSGDEASTTLELLLVDGGVFPHKGTIENTLNQVDPRTGTIEVQARFPNPRQTVLPGQFGRVRLQTARRESVIRIPQRAVQQNQGLESVFVVTAQNTVEARPVRTGPRVGEDWIIEQGLQAGDRVVVEGILSVRAGAGVRTVAYRSETNDASATPLKGE